MKLLLNSISGFAFISLSNYFMTDVDEIKRRLNIVDIIGEYVKLQKSGANFRARCPFHAEKTPSFFVSPEKEIWHCFGGCQKGGDIFRFLMEIESIEFGEALRILAKRAGVSLRQFTREEGSQKSLILRVNELASLFFQKALERAEGGKKALSYLRERGVNEENSERFKLGYAPSSWRSLLSFLEGKGYKRDDIIAAGLAIRNDEGRVYDRFRARLMFPIQNPVGHIVGFTGRTLIDDAKEAKYVNTPQTTVYDKSRELYGIYQAKHAIKARDEILLVEGNLDVILSSQAGIEQVVASSGTALTEKHLSLMRRYTKNLVFCFDSDTAGVDASKRAFEMALRGNFDVATLVVKDGKDPAEIVSKKGSDAWVKIYEQKKHLIEFLWEKGKEAHDLNTLKGKKLFINELFHFLNAMPNSIERGHWLGVMAKRLRVREEDIREEFQKFESIDKGFSKMYNKEDEKQVRQRDRMSQDRENLAALFLFYPHLKDEAFSHLHSPFGLEDLPISREELLLKAEVFWPTESMAKRELARIINHLTFIKKKEEVIRRVQG